MACPLAQRPAVDGDDFCGLIATSAQMRGVFRIVRQVGPFGEPVLIRGELGTGKELVAAAIHRFSARAEQPYRALNCATLDDEALSSVLFGHAAGAFSGAREGRRGLIVEADGGTVFLHEIGALPADVQRRLVRLMEDGALTPLGATETRHVDVRVIASTRCSLRRAVAAGTFREDLMYRLRVVPLFLPRLAEREGDIEVLLWHFIEAFNAGSGRRIDAVASATMDAMLEYNWPGNVRELRNVVAHAYAVGEGTTFTPEDLTPEIRGEPPPHDGGAGDPRTAERARILEALRQTDGKKGQAATLLGVSRSTLWRKLREHRLA
ncbi:MAG: sigma-54 dependent transcriptional regulator [Myxococcota bacterium]